jgi:hypothetical protein
MESKIEGVILIFTVFSLSHFQAWLGWGARKEQESRQGFRGRVDVVKVYVIKPVGSGGVCKKDKKDKKGKKGKAMASGSPEVTKPEVVLIAQRTAHNVSGPTPRNRLYVP